MIRIKTVWGEVKLISSNLEELSINGFRIPLDKTSEYVENINAPSEDFIKRIVEKILGKEVFFPGEKREFIVSCREESCREEIASSWKICFEMIKHSQQERKKTKLVNLRFACTKRDIPFEIKDNGIWIKIGKKEIQVPILIYPAIGSDLSVTFNFLGCCLEGIYR